MKLSRTLPRLLLLAATVTGHAGAADAKPPCDTGRVTPTASAHECRCPAPALPSWSELYDREHKAGAPLRNDQGNAGAQMAGTILLPLRMSVDHVLSLLGFLATMCVRAMLGS